MLTRFQQKHYGEESFQLSFEGCAGLTYNGTNDNLDGSDRLNQG